MRKTKKIAGAFALLTVFEVFTRFVSFVFKIYLSRTLGAEALGLYQIALSVFFLFASFSSSGIPTVLSRKTAESNALNKDKPYRLFSAALILGVSISLSLVIVLALLNNRLTFLFSEPLALPLFLIMIPALCSTAVYNVVRGWFWGEKDFAAFSITEMAEELLRVLFSVLFITGVFGALSGVYAISYAFTVSDVIVAIILLIIYFAKGGKITKPADLKTIFVPALPVTMMRVCGSLFATLIAFILPLRLMKFGMAADEATAYFGRIAGMANPLLFAPNAIIGSLSVVLIPEMSASMAKKEFEKLNKQLLLGINFAFLISGLFIVAYSSMGSEITSILYKDSESGIYLQIATFSMIPTCMMAITQSALNSIGKEYPSFVNYLVGNFFMITAIFILPKFIGIFAVAVATFIGSLISSTLNYLSLRKATGLDSSFAKYAILVIVFVLPCSLLSKWTFGLIAQYMPKILSVGIALTLGMLCYALLCLITNVLNVRGVILERFAKLKTPKA